MLKVVKNQLQESHKSRLQWCSARNIDNTDTGCELCLPEPVRLFHNEGALRVLATSFPRGLNQHRPRHIDVH